MKASDFNLSNEIKFDFDAGKTHFRDTRIVLIDANSLGLLRHKMIEKLGFEQARDFMLQYGFQNGYYDFTQLESSYDFESELELLSAGPVIHTWEGVVKAIPREISFDRAEGSFHFTGDWHNSYEAEQHLSYYKHGRQPVCWSLMGYASGWCSGFMNKPMLAIEPRCQGMGHDHCGWEIKPVDDWGEERVPYVKALKELFATVEKG
jgi:hypothetical protein